MSKEKQIEEKAKVITDICPFHKDYGSCERCNTALDTDEPCYYDLIANLIIRNNYRKQSEGEWIKDEKSKYEHRYYCSVCNFYLFGAPTNYCEECGARMKGGA